MPRKARRNTSCIRSGVSGSRPRIRVSTRETVIGVAVEQVGDGSLALRVAQPSHASRKAMRDADGEVKRAPARTTCERRLAEREDATKNC